MEIRPTAIGGSSLQAAIPVMDTVGLHFDLKGLTVRTTGGKHRRNGIYASL